VEGVVVFHLMQDRVDLADRTVIAMSQPASTIVAEATLEEAMRVLQNARSSHLVVVADGGHVIGVIGGRDLVAAWAGDPEALVGTPVTTVLDSVAPTVASTATVRTVARVMRDFRSDVVVIIGQSRAPVGIVTAGDLVASIAAPA
jgi:CBS-domain-containing membrane protein